MRILLIAAVAVCFLVGNAAIAEEVVIWHGWANIARCGKVVKVDGYRYVTTTSQELYTVVKFNHDAARQLGDVAAQCTKEGTAKAAFAALADGGPVAYPAAKAAWTACMSTKGISVAESALNISSFSKCNW